MDMPERIKSRISGILGTLLGPGGTRYRFEVRFIRWGLVEQDMHEAIDSEAAPVTAELTRLRGLLREAGGALKDAGYVVRALVRASIFEHGGDERSYQRLYDKVDSALSRIAAEVDGPVEP